MAKDVTPPDRPRQRGKGLQHVLQVARREQLSPHMVRLHFSGPGVIDFLRGADPAKVATTDKYVKILFAPRHLGLQPPYDLDALRDSLAPEDMPVRRTYTVRAVDADFGTLAIDFVVHGDEGIAGPWAGSAQPGDMLALSGPGGDFAPSADPGLERLDLGDDSALPAIAALLEALPVEAIGRVFIEVDGPDDEQALTYPAGVQLTWLHRSQTRAVPGTLLANTVRALPPSGPAVEVFAHGERGAMKAIRAVLQDDWKLERRSMSLSAYWALGRVEDAFQAEKRQPIGAIFTD